MLINATIIEIINGKFILKKLKLELLFKIMKKHKRYWYKSKNVDQNNRYTGQTGKHHKLNMWVVKL